MDIKIATGFSYHWAAGIYDYKYWTPDATFDVPGHGVMAADEFGNYVAGYSGAWGLGSPGVGGVKVGGNVIAIMGRGEAGGSILDSPGSTCRIDQGAADASRAKQDMSRHLPWWISLFPITL